MTKQFATPGPRAIYPEMCASPSLGRCSILANALFPRLIAMADDQGRLVGDPQSILIECLGRLLRLVTIEEVAAALDELESEEVLQRYTAERQEYVQLTGWWRWQASMRRAYPSRWPAPKGWGDLVFGNSKDEPETWKEAVAQGSQRNAAIRGALRRTAARATGAHAGPRTGPRARAMPDPTVPDPTVPSGASSPPGANGAGGLAMSAQAILDDPRTSADAKQGARELINLRGQR